MDAEQLARRPRAQRGDHPADDDMPRTFKAIGAVLSAPALQVFFGVVGLAFFFVLLIQGKLPVDSHWDLAKPASVVLGGFAMIFGGLHRWSGDSTSSEVSPLSRLAVVCAFLFCVTYVLDVFASGMS